MYSCSEEESELPTGRDGHPVTKRPFPLPEN